MNWIHKLIKVLYEINLLPSFHFLWDSFEKSKQDLHFNILLFLRGSFLCRILFDSTV